MNKVLTIATIVGLFGTLEANEKLECRAVPLSLYSVEHKNVKRIKSHRTDTIEEVRTSDGRIDYDKIYDHYSTSEGIKSYIRGQYLILTTRGRYFIRKVCTTHTARMNCKSVN